MGGRTGVLPGGGVDGDGWRAEDEAVRALIVDDEVSIRRVCSLVLGRVAEVTTVETSSEALAACEAAGAFDVVLVDLRLEAAMSGEALLREMRARWPSMRRVAFTASPQYLVDRGLVEAVLEKPYSNESLIRTVRGF